ncbi:universal stress protein UspA [Halorientalis sp. IM1011]|uniref:universal stress protein n=1 Tax=Halorientalis sp. IM1011 TaxID=1932360 RepID=UPI00097CCBB6|nr:universal stress protein [Halorientalis sp. IM1011]AQL43110.1 universal stress protein UspA [Halorientalis sp. IM1011]
MSAVAFDRVLAPLDRSEESLEAAEYAVAVAEQYGADVHALYLLEESVVRSLESGELEGDTVADDTEDLMETVDRLAADHDVSISHSMALGFVTTQLTHHPGSVILDTAEAVDADFLVVPREPISGNPDEVLGKAAEYVLQYASQPVLSV